MSIGKMTDLLKRQENERQDLAAGVYASWLPVEENEAKLLSAYGNKYENAPHFVQEEIDIARQVYFKEWGGDGKLTALMATRHAAEREKLMSQQKKFEQLRKDLTGRKDSNRGR
jgi:hypothetical protein